jgi:hypothetical protein
VSGSIDQVQYVLLTIERVIHLNCMALDGDPAFALKVHIIERLLLNISIADSASCLQQTISKGAFPVIDVRNDAEISDVLHKSAKLA